MSSEPKRRIPKTAPLVGVSVKREMVSSSSDPERVLDDALITASIEVARYKQKVEGGTPLDLKQARIMQGWIKSMVDLLKERREQERAADLGKLSEEEIQKLAVKYLTAEANTVSVEGRTPEEAEDVEDDNIDD